MHVVVVGGGLAGATAARALRSARDDVAVTLVSGEKHHPYDRPPLSKQVLLGKMTQAQVSILSEEEAGELGIDLLLGDKAIHLATEDRSIGLASGRTLPYTHLVVTTGSRPRVLPNLPASPHVHYLRSIEDSILFRDRIERLRRVLVVGAGFIGLEVAAVLRSRGVEVVVVEQQSAVLSRVLGPETGGLLANLHRERGVDIRCSTQIVSAVKRPNGVTVALSDGTRQTYDGVLVGIGAVPNLEWINDPAVHTDNGILCSSEGVSSVASVSAAGDVSRWRNGWMQINLRMEQWQSAVEQATIVAHNLAVPNNLRSWTSVPYFWSDQYEHKIQLCGIASERSEVIPARGGSVVVFGRGDALCGVLALDLPRATALGRRMLAQLASWEDGLAWARSLA